MFCYQCQETVKSKGCTIRGVCGKPDEVSNLQDVLLYSLKGLSLYAEKADLSAEDLQTAGDHVAKCLFATITNANFDADKITGLINGTVELRENLIKKYNLQKASTGCARISKGSKEDYLSHAAASGILSEPDEDIRSLRETIIYGLKGLAAYTHHAAVLGYFNPEIHRFSFKALGSTVKNLSQEELLQLVLETGQAAVKAMELLDKANTSTYGNPEITKVKIGVGKNPGILVSGHDLKDLEELLIQTQNQGVDIYTHSEMLPAHYYPAFKKYPHFYGNYGNAWWKQDKEFASFNGAILMTTNCIVPVREEYKNRIFTTGMAGYPGVPHISDRKEGNEKDFSSIITLAKTLPAPTEIESGEIVGGFAHAQVLSLADKVVEAVKSGDIKRFIVMAGCDGRQKSRNYYTEVAEELPGDTVILTAGCAKYRYNKLDLGDINGIPRVLDAGQCNDSYSLALTALKLKEVFNLQDINQLPLSFDIAWYEQKAVAVLLALLSLEVKGIRLGPTLPEFLSPKVAELLGQAFGIKGITEPAEDIAAMMQGN